MGGDSGNKNCGTDTQTDRILLLGFNYWLIINLLAKKTLKNNLREFLCEKLYFSINLCRAKIIIFLKVGKMVLNIFHW